LQGSGSKTVFVTSGATVFLCVLAADAGTLAPAIQYYGSGLSACLAAPPGKLKAKVVDTAFIKQMRQLQQEGKEDEVVAKFKGQLPAAALNFIMSALDFSYRHPAQLCGQGAGGAGERGARV
jgi:hypothetical protein